MVSSSLSRSLLRPAIRLQNVASELLTSTSGRYHLPMRVTNVACRRSMVSATSVLLEQRTMKLPGLGDSITEGTIVEWTASVGQAVKEGDVVALVETDKVTVDIKAEIDGVIVEQFIAVDDTIEVGADLYKIDTEAEASVVASSVPSESKPAPSPPKETTATSPPPAPAAESKQPTTTSSHHRKASIHFLGKEGWARRRAGEADQTPSIVYIPPMYGRPAFTEEEMEALVTGGASLAPGVKQYSSGAMFG